MSKVLDLKKSVFELTREYPEIKEIMGGMGFDKIVMPGMLNTAGKFMTIPKGAQMKGIAIEKVKEIFAEKGYEVVE